MHTSISLLLLAIFLSSPLQAFAQDRRTILAVMEIEDAAKKFKSEDVQMATDYLRGRLAATGQYVVIDKTRQAEALAKTLAESKEESYRECRAKECQIPLGQALSADSILRTGILFLGGVYSVQAELIDLSREATVKGATVDFDEEQGVDPARGLIKALKELVPQLVGEQAAPTMTRLSAQPTKVEPLAQPVVEQAPQSPKAKAPPRKSKAKREPKRNRRKKQAPRSPSLPENPRDEARFVYLGATGVNICVNQEEAKCEEISPSVALLLAPGFRFWQRYGIFLDLNLGWLSGSEALKSVPNTNRGLPSLMPDGENFEIANISTVSFMPTFRYFTRLWNFFEYYLSFGVGSAEIKARMNDGRTGSWKKSGNVKFGWGFMIPISPSLDIGYNFDFILHESGDAEICRAGLGSCDTRDSTMPHLIQSSGALIYYF